MTEQFFGLVSLFFFFLPWSFSLPFHVFMPLLCICSVWIHPRQTIQYRFTDELRDSGDISAMRLRVPQVHLPTAVSKAILAELDVQQRVERWVFGHGAEKIRVVGSHFLTEKLLFSFLGAKN